MLEKIDIRGKVLSANEKYSIRNSDLLKEHKILCLNMISSPGSGKTSILIRTIKELKDKIRIGVIEGDIKTDIDGQKISDTGTATIQINTEGMCHLLAGHINEAMSRLPMQNLDLIFIENIGNLVCPSAFDLGETAKVVVLSTAEGDDKPAKYPSTFARATVLLVNKTDMLKIPNTVDFDFGRATADARRLNKSLTIFPISAKTGDGFAGWCEWLVQYTEKLHHGR